MKVQFIRLLMSRWGRVAEIEKAELVRTDEGSVHKVADEADEDALAEAEKAELERLRIG